MSNGNAAQVYAANVVIPMIRRIYPSMMSSESIDNLNIPLSNIEIQNLRGRKFLSHGRLKQAIKEFRPKGLLRIVKVFQENGIPYKNVKAFAYPTEFDSFMVELATLADLHGIVKFSGHSIWVKQIGDVKDLNVDDKLIDRLSKHLTGRGFVS